MAVRFRSAPLPDPGGRTTRVGNQLAHWTGLAAVDRRPALPGPEGQKKIADDFRAAFPDLGVVVDLIVGEDDYVVGRWTATGTHSGRWGAVEPTGRQATFSAVNIYRFENGRVVEIWNHRDDLGLAEQVGYRSTRVRARLADFSSRAAFYAELGGRAKRLRAGRAVNRTGLLQA